MTTENIQINIREDGSRVAVINITAVANASANAGRQVDFLGMAFRRLAIAAAIRELVQMADTVTLLEARLRLAIKSAQEFTQAQEDIYRMSQTNNVGLAETTKLYTKLADPVRRLGGGLNEVTAIVDGFSTALRVGGANTQEAAAATLQFAQALSKGKLDGDEFKTLAETAPRFMRALADSMGVATGELKTMASQGKLTSDVIGNGMISQLKVLKAEAATLRNTVGGAFSDLTNDAMITVGAFDKMTGATSMMADVVQGVSYLVFQLGKVFKDEAADGAMTANDQFRAMTPIIQGLGIVFETLLVLGANVSFTFKAIGREIGGIAAQVTALLNRDWEAIPRIRQMMIEDGRNSLAELERFQGRILGVTDKAMAQRDKANSGGTSQDNVDYVTLKTVASEKDLVAVRMRLAGINKSYFSDLATLQDALEAGNVTQAEYIKLMSELATKTYESSKAGKDLKKSLVGNDDRLKIMQDNLVKSQTIFEREQAIFEQRGRMLDMYHDKFNLSDEEYYAGREAARKEFLASEQATFERERAMIQAFKPKNNNEVADQQLRLSKLLKDHEDFNNKMASLRTDDLLARMANSRAIQDASDETVNKYLSSQYETLQGLKETTQAREVSKSSIERETVAIYEQALANMRLQASLPVGQNGRTQADQDSANSFIAFLQSELDLRQDITAELEKQEGIKNSRKASEQLVKDWKDASRDIADSFGNTFGNVGTAFGDMIKSFSDGVTDHMQIMRRLADSTKGMDDNDPRKVDAVKKAKLDSAKAQIKSYGDMAGAAKGFFKENSKGYQVLETTEKAFRAFELGLAMKSMVEKIFFKEGEVAANLALNGTKIAGETVATGVSTGLAATEASAWGITAVVKAIASLPFPMNIAAGAATLAAVVAIGAKMFGNVTGGSVSLSEQRQKTQGTGSVFGDKSAKSESIARSIELSAANSSIELNYTQGMLRALLGIQSSLQGLGNLLIRGSGVTGGVPATTYGAMENSARWIAGFDSILGGFVGKATGAIQNAIFGGKTEALDTGLTANRVTVSQAKAGGLRASQYTDMEEDGGAFHSDDSWTDYTALGSEANSQFSKIISDMAGAIGEAGKLLGVGGDEFTKRLNNFVVDIGKISLKDLTGEQIQEQLEAVFSKVGDDMAKYAVAELAQFQKVGEGYLETLTRIAMNYANLDASLQSIGMEFTAKGVYSVATREHLLMLSGGMEEFASKVSSFADNFLTESERLAPVQKYVTEQMKAMGLAHIDTMDEFKNHVQGLELLNEAERNQFVAMMDLESSFAKVYGSTKDLSKSQSQIADEYKDLKDRLDELTMSSAQRRAKERAAVAAENRTVFDQIAAREDLLSAYEREADAMKSVIDRLSEFQRNVVTFRDSLALGNQSTMTPVERAAEAERQYTEMLAKAKSGDKNAQSGITSAASAYLTATQIINASDEKQHSIFERVRADMAMLASSAGLQLTESQQQLDAMERSVSGLITLNETTLSMKDALIAVLEADRMAAVAPEAAAAEASPIVAELQGVRADNEKMQENIAKLWDALNTQTEALIRATYGASDKNAKTTNEGSEKAARLQIWNLRTTEIPK